MIDFLQTWIPIILSVYSGVYVSYRLMKRNETKEKIEYFEKKAADLEKRYEKLDADYRTLEATVMRYRMMKDYVFKVLGPDDSVVKQAQMILDQELEFKPRRRDKGNDVTEAHE